MHTHAHTETHTYMCLYTHTHLYMHANTYPWTHIYIYTQMHTHIMCTHTDSLQVTGVTHEPRQSIDKKRGHEFLLFWSICWFTLAGYPQPTSSAKGDVTQGNGKIGQPIDPVQSLLTYLWKGCVCVRKWTKKTAEFVLCSFNWLWYEGHVSECMGHGIHLCHLDELPHKLNSTSA